MTMIRVVPVTQPLFFLGKTRALSFDLFIKSRKAPGLEKPSDVADVLRLDWKKEVKTLVGLAIGLLFNTGV